MKRLLVGIAVLGLAACGGKQKGEEAATASAGVSGELTTLLALVPPQTSGVFMIDQAISDWGGAVSEERAKAMRAELEAYIDRELGIDPLDARAFVVFGGLGPAGPMAGLIARPVSGELKSDALEVADGFKLQATLLDGTLVLGLPGTADQVAEAAKSGKSVADSWPWFSEWVKAGPRTVAAAVDLAPIRPLLGPKLPPGIDRATMAFGGGRVAVTVHGDQDTLSSMRAELAEGMDEGLEQLKTAKSELTAPGEPALPGIMSIVGYHLMLESKEQLPAVTNGVLALDVPFDASPTMAVGVVGVLSAVAIPAFMKYIAKSKTTEAKMFLRKMADGARAYAYEQGKGAFPPAAPLTPSSGPCGADKCEPNAEQWAHPGWTALMFSVDDPHYYAYEFVSDGSSFTARAMGDLDGDGIPSVFELYGEVKDGEPVVSPDFVIENELE